MVIEQQRRESPGIRILLFHLDKLLGWSNEVCRLMDVTRKRHCFHTVCQVRHFTLIIKNHLINYHFSHFTNFILLNRQLI